MTEITLDGMWEIPNPTIGVGDVMRIRKGGPSSLEGWAFVQRVEPARTQPSTGQLLPPTAILIGAVVADAPTRTERDYTGQEFVIEQHNFGIDEKLIEQAIRHLAIGVGDSDAEVP